MTRMRGYEQFNKYTHTHTQQVSLIPPWEDQCEWHRMTRMTGPDCAVMCNLINTHTHTHTHTHMYIERGRERGFIHRRYHGHSTTGTLPRYGSYRESYGMAAGTPGCKIHLVEPHEIAGPARRWSRARSSDGRELYGNG